MPKKKQTVTVGAVKRQKLSAGPSNVDQDDEEQDPLPTLYRCPLCTAPIYSTLKSKTMSQHLNSHHKGEFYPGTKKKLVAGLCKVQDEDEIKMLMKSKSKTNFPFPCPEIDCDKGFMLASSRYRHRNEAHNTVFNYCCTLCGRLEVTISQMKTHLTRNHSNETCSLDDCENRMAMLYSEAATNGTEVKQVSYPCYVEGCDKICDFPHLLRTHLQSHDETDKQCQYCFKRFITPYQCRIHVSSMHDPSLKTWKCELGNGCEKSFSAKKELKKHQEFSRIHTKPKFECDICHRLFQYPLNLANHQQQKCEPRSEPKYRCQDCGRRYYRQHNLEKHSDRHANGTLNLKIPSEATILRYKKLIRACNDEIYMKKCNKNQVVDEESPTTHLILVPCSHADENGVKCKKTAVMYSSAPTPYHHLKMLLHQMIHGLACTSLHSHFDGDGHDPDIAAAKFVASGNSSYEMHIVKKLVVKMGKKEKTLTNYTQFEPYHVYDKSALEEIATMMTSQNLSSKSHSQLITDMDTELKGLLNESGTSTVRDHPPLVFDTVFHFKTIENEELSELKKQILDEQNEEKEGDDEEDVDSD